MNYIERAKELAKANAPDREFDELIEAMAYDESITHEEYVELYSKRQDIYWNFLMEG